MSWIWITIFAAFMQSLRTAAQKRLAERMSTWAATYVRALVGLPVMVAWVGVLTAWTGEPLPWPTPGFLALSLVVAVTQNVATAMLLSLYRLKGFAAANQLAKSDVIFTALLGLPLGQWITPAGWAAIGLATAGVTVISSARAGGGGMGWRELARSPALRIGLGVGLLFAICNQALREATLVLPSGSLPARAGLTVVVSTLLQVVLLGAWLGRREPGALGQIVRSARLSAFVGVTSALGSIAWFAAFASTNAGYVRAVGQIEVVFSVLLSLIYFRERLTGRDWLGIALTVAGVLVLRLAA